MAMATASRCQALPWRSGRVHTNRGRYKPGTVSYFDENALVANDRSPLLGHSDHSLGGVFLALGLSYDMILARRIRPRVQFSRPSQNPVTDFSHFFSSPSQRLRPLGAF